MDMSLSAILDVLAQDMGEPFNDFLKQRLRASVIEKRALFIRREIAKHGGDDALLSKIKFTTKVIDAADSCDVTSGCKILQSVEKVPEMVRLKGRLPFTFVGSRDSKKSFTYVRPEEFNFTLCNKFTSAVIRYTIDDSYFKIYGSLKPIKGLAVGIVADIKELPVCEGEPCYTDDMPFPVTADLRENIIRAILQEKRDLENPEIDYEQNN